MAKKKRRSKRNKNKQKSSTVGSRHCTNQREQGVQHVNNSQQGVQHVNNSHNPDKDILCLGCNTIFTNESTFIAHNNVSHKCKAKNQISTCYNCYKSFASRTNLDKHLSHKSFIQCRNKHYNDEFLNAHGSRLCMNIEANTANNPETIGNLIEVRQQQHFPHLSVYAQANINMLSSMQILQSQDNDESCNTFPDEDIFDADPDNAVANDDDQSCDMSMIERKQMIDKIRSLTCFEDDYTAALELEQILHKSGAPLGLFNSVMSWARKNHDNIPMRAEIYTRNKLYDASKAKLYGTWTSEKKRDKFVVSSNEPKLIQCTLPSKRAVTVPIFSFKENVCSILSDKNIMTKENLIYTELNGNPFHVDIHNNGMYGDVHQSQWWKASDYKLIKDPNTQLMVPIIFYLDALVLDAYGKLSLEPLSFTLGILRRHCRNQKHAYRTLGFVEDLDHLYGANHITPDQKAEDYHCIMELILEEFKKVQADGGFEWDFVIDGVTYRRTLFFPLMFFIGDCKGHDVLCGRNASHRCIGLCRDCDCTLASSDDPMINCSLYKQSDISKMDDKQRKDISFRPLRKNAFENVCYGANHWGINRATPPEPLHLILLGMCMVLIASLYSVFPAKAMVELDELVAKISSEYGRQSDRNMPDVRPFRAGLSKTSRLTAKQKYGRVFVIFMALNTESFANKVIKTKYNLGSQGHKQNYGKAQYKKLLLVFEEVLLYYKWVCKAEHRHEDFIGDNESKASSRLRVFLKDYIAAAPRHTGLKHKTTKDHQTIHWFRVIPYFGSALNVDSGRGESIASPNAKDHGKHTQKRAVTLNQQTALRLHEKQIFDEARVQCGSSSEEVDYMDPEDLTNEQLLTRERLLQERNIARMAGTAGGSYFRIELKYSPTDEMRPHDISLTWKSNKGSTGRFNKTIISAVGRRLMEFNNTRTDSFIVSIQGFTELNKVYQDDDNMKHLFRAHPGYYDGRPWHDWATVQWEAGDLLGKLQMFLNFDVIETQTRTLPFVTPPNSVTTPNGARINISDATPTGLHVVISTVKDNPRDTSKAFMKTKLGRRLEISKDLQIVKTDAILGTAYVIEEDYYNDTLLPKMVVSYLHVTKWGSLFLPEDWCSEEEMGTFNEPDRTIQSNTVNAQTIMEEHRAEHLRETFDGYVDDYIEE